MLSAEYQSRPRCDAADQFVKYQRRRRRHVDLMLSFAVIAHSSFISWTFSRGADSLWRQRSDARPASHDVLRMRPQLPMTLAPPPLLLLLTLRMNQGAAACGGLNQIQRRPTAPDALNLARAAAERCL